MLWRLLQYIQGYILLTALLVRSRRATLRINFPVKSAVCSEGTYTRQQVPFTARSFSFTLVIFCNFLEIRIFSIEGSCKPHFQLYLTLFICYECNKVSQVKRCTVLLPLQLPLLNFRSAFELSGGIILQRCFNQSAWLPGIRLHFKGGHT